MPFERSEKSAVRRYCHHPSTLTHRQTPHKYCAKAAHPPTGDQDFFEALGFRHHIASDEYKYDHADATLRDLAIDRIYDAFIDEDELRICDETIHQITNALGPAPTTPTSSSAKRAPGSSAKAKPSRRRHRLHHFRGLGKEHPHLKEASSWGKVDLAWEQMVYSESTLAFPLIAGYVFHKQAHAARKQKN